MTTGQRKSTAFAMDDIKGHGNLDFVTGWYIKSAKYIQSTGIKVGFVSTNSISQGEQAGVLWNYLFQKFKIKIHFAHRTFEWSNEAKGKAAVHVVIIGFASFDVNEKFIFDYEDKKGVPQKRKVNNISPYLIEGPDFAIENRQIPLCSVPKLKTGNKPVDGGNYIFTKDEMEIFVRQEPLSKDYFKPFIGAEEFINNKLRYILWLRDISPTDLKKLPLIQERIKAVMDFRSSSLSSPTRKIANMPTKFHTENYPINTFLIIPQVSSERRKYIPIAFQSPGLVCSDKLRILDNATLYHFGVLVSIMHMTWMRVVTGRLKSDYQYSVLTVYNNFPWPESPTVNHKARVEEAAQAVLTVRTEFSDGSLADLYDPITMPPKLVKAHQELNKAVDLAYRPQPFLSEVKRMEFLFELYEKYTANLFTPSKLKKAKKV